MPNPKIVTVGSLALALLLGALVVHARENDEPKIPTLGVVDMERVYAASDAPQQLDKQSVLIETEAQKRMESLRDVAQLSGMELEEYVTLIAKAQSTPDQQNRIKELKTLSDQRVNEFRSLQMKANLTPQEQTRLKELQQQSRIIQQNLPNLLDQLRSQALLREDEVKRGLIAQLRTEVAKVAQEKKIAHVFDTSAMVYSANDITQAVVQRVAKHK